MLWNCRNLFAVSRGEIEGWDSKEREEGRKGAYR